MSTSKEIKKVLSKEKKKFKESKLQDSYKKFEKAGINLKSSYNLPLKDTIGKDMYEQIHCHTER